VFEALALMGEKEIGALMVSMNREKLQESFQKGLRQESNSQRKSLTGYSGERD
jgi:hypothetical protein